MSDAHDCRPDARAEYAVWPGSACVAARVACRTHPDDDAWYLGHCETGEISLLVAYRHGMLRGVER